MTSRIDQMKKDPYVRPLDKIMIREFEVLRARVKRLENKKK